jgi:hypothetical protein
MTSTFFSKSQRLFWVVVSCGVATVLISVVNFSTVAAGGPWEPYGVDEATYKNDCRTILEANAEFNKKLSKGEVMPDYLMDYTLPSYVPEKDKEQFNLNCVGLRSVLGMTTTDGGGVVVGDGGASGGGSGGGYSVEDGMSAAGEAAGKRGDVASIVGNVVEVLMYVVGIVAVIIIILAGIMYATAAGDEAKVKKAKNALIGGIVGLAIAVLAWAIVDFVVKGL